MRVVIDLGDEADRVVREVRKHLMTQIPGLRAIEATRLVRRYIRERLGKRLADEAARVIRPMEYLAGVRYYVPSDLLDEARKAVGNAPYQVNPEGGQ